MGHGVVKAISIHFLSCCKKNEQETHMILDAPSEDKVCRQVREGRDAESEEECENCNNRDANGGLKSQGGASRREKSNEEKVPS